jgi:hypothetical protein
MNKVDYNFNPSSYRLMISYTGIPHKVRVERAYVHQFDGWLEDNKGFLEGSSGWVIRDENGKFIKKG